MLKFTINIWHYSINLNKTHEYCLLLGCRGWGDHLVDAGKSIVDVVDTFVIVSGAQVFETLVTDSTVVGSLPCVHSHVDSKVILLAKFPSTLIALKQDNNWIFY